MADTIDLHMHTTASDGLQTPAELLALVRTKDLTAFAVTDHDTIDGFYSMTELVRSSDPELVSGVELSVEVDGSDMHMLAYLFDPYYEPFVESLGRFQQQRVDRGKKMVHKLQALGLKITFEDVQKTAQRSVIGRPHVADTLIRLGQARSTEEVFRKYLGYNCPGYVAKATWEPKEAISLVHEAGGLAVMAHPYLADMQRHIPHLVPLGLDGVEAYHYTHSKNQVEILLSTAKQFDLVATGGSDFHGRSDRDGSVGSQQVPASCLVAMKERANQKSRNVR